ncbi:hypothetical protein [Streptomyces sp. NPDC018833]|uniref:hypothetical protein n=1 Tax=Streptomyces sp. NPDC018833 TaxID=3365053 RepID=UPI0037B4F1DA
MISVKIRGSIMAVTAAVAAATVFMAPTVSADTKPTQSAAVVTDKDKGDKDKKGDEKKNCEPIFTQLGGRLQLAEDSLGGTTPDIDTARTALAQADRRLSALEDNKCACVAQLDLLRDLLDSVFAVLNGTTPDVPEARERLFHLIVAFDVLQAGTTCDKGKCGGDDMING